MTLRGSNWADSGQLELSAHVCSYGIPARKGPIWVASWVSYPLLVGPLAMKGHKWGPRWSANFICHNKSHLRHLPEPKIRLSSLRPKFCNLLQAKGFCCVRIVLCSHFYLFIAPNAFQDWIDRIKSGLTKPIIEKISDEGFCWLFSQYLVKKKMTLASRKHIRTSSHHQTLKVKYI